MTDPREFLSRLGIRALQYDRLPTGAGNDGINTVDWALRKVPAGVGRDLMLHLHGPGSAKEELWQLYKGISELVMTEAIRLELEHQMARTEYGKTVALATFLQDNSEATKREIAIAKAKKAATSYSCWPDSLPERLPALGVLLVDHLVNREEPSNRAKAKALQMVESTYRDGWDRIYQWTLLKLKDLEEEAAQAFGRALAEERRAA